MASTFPLHQTPNRSVPLAVLDTNVLFDWLVFDDPVVRPLAAALVGGRLAWIASPAIRDEFWHVLGRGAPGGRAVDLARCEEAWRRHAQLAEPAPPPLALPRCTDPDDQKFVELATTAGARWLLTKDRAVLRMRKRLARYGVEVATPVQWDERRDDATAA